jgi:hypothetical protein
MKVDTSLGDVADKYTILCIKKVLLTDIDLLFNVTKEWVLLRQEMSLIDGLIIDPLLDELLVVNNKLWHIEEEIRELENIKDFGEHFIATARMIYKLKDERHYIIQQINNKYPL